METLVEPAGVDGGVDVGGGPGAGLVEEQEGVPVSGGKWAARSG